MDEITLDQKELKRYVGLGAYQDIAEMDDKEAHITHQVGMFFVDNLWLANYILKIEELILTPRGEKITPLSVMKIRHRRRTYTVTSDSFGKVVKPWLRSPYGRR